MIVIMPDAEKTYYINSSDGKVMYEDFFIKELIPGVEKTFRIRSEKKYRGIAGFSKAFGSVPGGANRLTPFYRAHSILDIVKNEQASDLSKVRYWIDCGDDDPLSEGNCLLHMMFLEKKIPHEFRIRDGAHNWIYWRSGIVEALKFIGDSFR